MSHRGDYTRDIRIAWQPASDTLRITIPDSIGFPATTLYMALRDVRTIRLSPNAFPGGVSRDLTYQERLPGCREIQLNSTRLAGHHFAVMRTTYRVDGSDLLIDIPDEALRHPPKQYLNRGRHGAALLTTPKKFIEAIVGHPVEEVSKITSTCPYDVVETCTVSVPNTSATVRGEEIAGERVVLLGYGSKFNYNIPVEAMLSLIDQLSRYRCD